MTINSIAELTRWRAGSLVALAAAVAFTAIPVSVRGESAEDVKAETVESGILFIDGEFIAAPFEIETTPEVVRINGQTLHILQPKEDAAVQRGSGRRRNPAGPRPGARKMGFARENSRPGRPADEISSRNTSLKRDANRLMECLNADGIVVLFKDQPLRELTLATEQYALLEAITTTDASSEQIKVATSRAGTDTERDLWQSWLKRYEPTQGVRRQLQNVMDEIDAAEVRGLNQIAATARLESLSYPLTIGGMLIGVIAFGHMLQWIGHGIGRGDAESAESQRFVVVALGLMAGMSLLDLVWTILAGRAGAMRELNPVAASFIHSPAQLALFKVLATGVGFSILFAWRRRQQIQHATWWMCLVCILLTFRWVMFDSMMN